MADEGVVAEVGTTTEGEGSAQGAPAIDFSPINDRLGQLETGMRDDLASIRDQLTAPQEEAEEEAFPWDQWGEQGEDDSLELTQDQLQQIMDQRAAQALSPIQEQLQQMQYQQLASGVEERHPELKNKETAEQVVSEAFQRAAAFGLSQAAAQNPLFLEQTHEAMEYRRLKAEMQPAGESQSDGLESVGARPGTGGPSREEQYAERITNKQERHLW